MPLTRGWGGRSCLALLLTASLTALVLAGPAPSTARSATASVDVIVQQRGRGPDAAADAVRRAGGEVRRHLPVVDGVAATVPAAAVGRLEARPGTIVSPDREVRFQHHTGDGQGRSVFAEEIRATGAWSKGLDGSGVTVALIDTGVAEVPDLAGRIVPILDDPTGTTTSCVNLTDEAGCGDSFGHGTFMAGLIAGDGASSGGLYKGVAPRSRLVSIKIAGRSGAADVSSILAAIQWVVSFRDRYDIRVLNLSLGTDSTQSWRTDPLNFAVERAWHAGVTVVVSASNRGPEPGTITKPADDPWVITAAAVDDRHTATIDDDRLPDFSGRGPTADGLSKPDLVAPGSHVVSLRSPGSAIEEQFPDSGVDGTYRRGSGTSMSAAITSGAAALVLQANPGFTPNRVKRVLTATARPVASDDRLAVGAGIIDAQAAALAAPPGSANKNLDRSSGRGDLDASRDDARVRASDGSVVEGGRTLQKQAWDAAGYTGGEWTGSSWYGSSWYGSSWYGSSWYGSSWYGSSWYGSSWYGQMEGSSWYGSSWYGSSWYGAWD